MTLDRSFIRAALELISRVNQQPSARDDVLDIIDTQRRELLVEIFPVAPIGQRRWYIALMCAKVQHVPVCSFHAVDKEPGRRSTAPAGLALFLGRVPFTRGGRAPPLADV